MFNNMFAKNGYKLRIVPFIIFFLIIFIIILNMTQMLQMSTIVRKA